MSRKQNGDETQEFFDVYRRGFEERAKEEFSIREYLDACRSEPRMYASPHGRLLGAIGEPVLVDTSKDERLGRIFENRILRTYPEAFKDFYGIWPVLENLVSFLVRADQGLDEKQKIIYLLGPTAGGKSTLANRLKVLMERVPFYVLTYDSKTSPIFESPLGLFSGQEHKNLLIDTYGIKETHIPRTMSPWASQLVRENGGDISGFKVIKLFPSILNQIGIAEVDPGDENNQDISTLVGKTDIRKLEDYSQNDPRSYSYSGGLNCSTQGLMEFVEMFKASLKVLNPLLTATYDRAYQGSERIGAFPYGGIVLAHSNEAEWESFRNNKRNEAFLSRISLIKVPYVLQVDEVAEIYRKLVRKSDKLRVENIAPHTVELLATFSVLASMKDPGDNSTWRSKLRVYNGENVKNTDPKARTIRDYRKEAGVTEGMSGFDPRIGFEVLSRTFNFDIEEVAANPVHLFHVLEDVIQNEQLGDAKEVLFLGTFLPILREDFLKKIDRKIRAAYVESYDEYGQNLFGRYIMYADHWIDGRDFRDPDTGTNFEPDALNNELERIEKPAGIVNPKDFRNEIVKYALRYRAEHDGESPGWRAYAKIRKVIEANMFVDDDKLIPVISFSGKKSKRDKEKHHDFVSRMMEDGYTKRQVHILVDWWEQMRKNR